MSKTAGATVDNAFGSELDGALALAAVAVEELLERQKAQTAMKDLEMQLDLRQKFFSLVSHDLRQPLTVIKASAGLIRRHPESAEICSSLSTRIVDAVDRADRMIMDLLDANRLRAGLPLTLKRSEFDLDVLLSELLPDLALIYGEHFEYNAGVPIVGNWDDNALRRSIINLLTNAVKYGEPGQPITITVAQEPERVRVAVHNFGSAIAPEDMDGLFRWHNRTVEARQSGKDGWGLGLMLVKGIAEAHGGSVSVVSTEAAGTTFTIELPRNAIG